MNLLVTINAGSIMKAGAFIFVAGLGIGLVVGYKVRGKVEETSQEN